MERICERTQEAIAIGTELAQDGKIHIDSCEKCRLLLAEYQSLQLLVSASSDVDVPVGFADVVMRRIDEEAAAPETDWIQSVFSRFERLLSVPQVQYLALGAGGAVALVNLVRFVLYVLIPVT